MYQPPFSLYRLYLVKLEPEPFPTNYVSEFRLWCAITQLFGSFAITTPFSVL